jgi:SAM-dependent methyltransferase
MGDVWAVFSELDSVTQERLAGVLETRGADAQQQAMRRAFLREIDFPLDARVLEVGCGTGVLTRQLAGVPNVDAVVGVDLSPFLLARARKLAAGLPNVSFTEADARSLPFESEAFDVVVFDSTLSHVSAPSAPSKKPFVCWRRPVTWRSSTGITRPRRLRSVITTRFKPASRR